MSRTAFTLAPLLLLACAPSGTLVIASEGATLRSEDSAFVLVIPAGALPEDTRVSIRALPTDEWPRATGRAAPIGAVYAIEPEGLILDEDAWGAFVFDTSPGALTAADGSDTVASAYLRTPARTSPAPATRTIHLADGRTAVIATLYELGTCWASAITVDTGGLEVRSLSLSMRIDADAASHAVGEEWLVADAELTSDDTLAVVRREVWTSLARGAADAALVEPSGGPATRTWDATHDQELGLHPFELFDREPTGREETIGIALDVVPITLDPNVPLAPVVSPLPGWTCTGPGSSGSLFVGVDAVSGASSGTVRLGVARELGAPTCE